MIKVMQFGEGNFLRTFVDAYFDSLNKEGYDYGVYIVKPIRFGSVEGFEKQNNKYNIVLRGMENGVAAEKVYHIDSLKQVIDPFSDIDPFYALAVDSELKIIVSNTTEAGICFNENDDMDGFEDITYPAKLTKFLYKRYKAGLEGVYILPVELIENNADELYRCVSRYIELWELEDGFKAWNDSQNRYCNTLVDRIVSGFPKDEHTKKHLYELIGSEDMLVSVGEPFGLWAVEKKGSVDKYIIGGKHNIDVVVTEDIPYYKKRKVRVLNGSHTNMVAAGIVLGKHTVDECMTDKKFYSFFEKSMEEIIPYVSDDVNATREFAAGVTERFKNPFLNHQLMSIALNSISKWRARNLPTFKDYYCKNGKIPENLTVGFSYLMYLYNTQTASLKDDKKNLDFFESGKPICEFMADESVWGEDLTEYEGFAEAVESNMAKIEKGESLI